MHVPSWLLREALRLADGSHLLMQLRRLVFGAVIAEVLVDGEQLEVLAVGPRVVFFFFRCVLQMK